MLFKRHVLEGIGAGRITLAFRRWSHPTVKAGGSLRTAAGVLSIRSIEPITADDLTDADARRAGFGSSTELLRDIEGQRPGTLYRIAFRLEGEDPRIALRAKADLSSQDRHAIDQRLDRLDAGKAGAWTRQVLDMIGENPGRRAADLAAERGESDLRRFKSKVRQLKELGLTESLDVGYQLSPRGRAFRRGAKSSSL